MSNFDCPVLLMVFNRPQETQQVFDCLRILQPRRLFIAADGPRPDKPTDKELSTEVRSIVQKIDWECDLKLLFRTQNLGCGKAVSEAISWFFEHVEAGIILEDDCIPSIDFFTFCKTLLAHYQNNDRIMMVSGSNFVQNDSVYLNTSYYFAAVGPIWGWATWKRAWTHYDYEMTGYATFKAKNQMKEIFSHSKLQKIYYKIFDSFLKNNMQMNTWDYQWQFTMMQQRGVAIIPKVNLVTNIGFDKNATHTQQAGRNSFLKTGFLQELIHPEIIEKNEHLVRKFYEQHLKVAWISRIWGRIKSILIH